eukprot:774790-Amphidinium_carterae.1
MLYNYGSFLEVARAAPTKAQRIVEAAIFIHVMLSFKLTVTRRIKGVVARRLTAKPRVRQADALTASQ